MYEEGTNQDDINLSWQSHSYKLCFSAELPALFSRQSHGSILLCAADRTSYASHEHKTGESRAKRRQIHLVADESRCL